MLAPLIQVLALDVISPYQTHSKAEVRKLVSEVNQVVLVGWKGVERFGQVYHFVELEPGFVEEKAVEEK